MKSGSSTWVILTFLSLTLTMSSSVLVLYQSRFLKQAGHAARLNENDPHLERLPGRFEQASMIVQENDQFSLSDEEGWSPRLFGANGFVRMGEKGRSFFVAFYHQLHCVDGLRSSYVMARDGLVTDPEELKSKLGHDNHCFQFIRESILCKADNSLTPWNARNESLARAGFGVKHRCRNWAQVRQSVIDNDDEWEGIPELTEGDVVEFNKSN